MTDQTQSQPYPRLSTHILLGDHLRERDPSQWLDPNGHCGCALGGALISAGRLPAHQLTYGVRLQDVTAPWPWLDKTVPFNSKLVRATAFSLETLCEEFEVTPVVNIPLGSYGPYTSADCDIQKTFLWAISDLFIRVYHGSLTIEALADQVRVWEEEYDDDLRASLSLSLSLSLSSSDPADNLRQGAGDLAASGESASVSELVRSAS